MPAAFVSVKGSAARRRRREGIPMNRCRPGILRLPLSHSPERDDLGPKHGIEKPLSAIPIHQGVHRLE